MFPPPSLGEKNNSTSHLSPDLHTTPHPLYLGPFWPLLILLLEAQVSLNNIKRQERFQAGERKYQTRPKRDSVTQRGGLASTPAAVGQVTERGQELSLKGCHNEGDGAASALEGIPGARGKQIPANSRIKATDCAEPWAGRGEERGAWPALADTKEGSEADRPGHKAQPAKPQEQWGRRT